MITFLISHRQEIGIKNCSTVMVKKNCIMCFVLLLLLNKTKIGIHLSFIPFQNEKDNCAQMGLITVSPGTTCPHSHSPLTAAVTIRLNIINPVGLSAQVCLHYRIVIPKKYCEKWKSL